MTLKYTSKGFQYVNGKITNFYLFVHLKGTIKFDIAKSTKMCFAHLAATWCLLCVFYSK